MKKYLVHAFVLLLAKLPLRCVHQLGSLLGFISDKLSKRARLRLRSNLLRTQITTPATNEVIARQCAREWGKTILETICIAWQWSPAKIARLFTRVDGLAAVEQALSQGKAIIFLTPHIGNFEIALKYTAQQLAQHQFTVLYKPNKDALLESMMRDGRSDTNITAVATNRTGITALIKALRRGEIIGILPDNVASQGDGVWVNFFGVPVYAPTLAAKLCRLDNTATFLVNSVRHKNGFSIEYIPFNANASDNVTNIVQNMYQQFELMVSRTPTQYYWSYDRFRTPNHAPAKE